MSPSSSIPGDLVASPTVEPGIWGQPEFVAAYAAEHAWLSAAGCLELAASRLMAARIGAGAVAIDRMPVCASRDLLTHLRANRSSVSALQQLARGLGFLPPNGELSAADAAQVCGAWALAVPLDTLLASGGDDRLTLDPVTGLNRYGCAPRPRTEVVSFGSCTASSLSPHAYRAAEQGRRTLIAAALRDGCESAVREASAGVEGAILAAFGCGDLAEAILTASGTDAALTVTALLSAERPYAPITSIVVSPAETGSGVPLAVQGCHFADVAASGDPVSKGKCLSGIAAPLRLVTIDVRDAAGQPLTQHEIFRACDSAIRAALRHGRVVLHAIDGSKTGLTAPERGALLELARTYGKDVDIVVDACQARIEPVLVRAYLAAGFPVLVTGSKFFGAPGFCGAILFPRGRLARLVAQATIPAGLSAYVGRAGSIGSRCCPGLVLRWTAALHEMGRFGALPDAEISRRLEAIGASIRSAVRADRGFDLVSAPRPAGSGWSSRRSVFTFTVRDGRGLLDPRELRSLYLALQDDLSATAIARGAAKLASTRCQIGQPVQLGNPSIGGLRLAVSASDVVEGADQSARVCCVMNKLGLLLQADEQLAPQIDELSEAAA